MRLEFKLKRKDRNFGKLKIFLVLLGAVIALYLSPLKQKGIDLSQKTWTIFSEKAHWNLTQVVVEGHKRTDKQTIIKTLGVEPGQSMDSISLTTIRQNLLQLPWIKDVMVERHLPDTLIIRITEKTPIALWQNKQNYFPLDEEGHPILDDKLLPADLILVVGSDAPENTLSLLAALEKVPQVSKQVRSAVRVEKRRWNLHLMDAEAGVKIILPETEFEKALKRLAYQYKKEDLLKKNIEAIDLRLSDRIILHPPKRPTKNKGKKK